MSTPTQRQFRLTFFVPGIAAPQGSKTPIGNNRMIESSRAVGPWRDRVAIAAHNVRVEHPDLPLPLTDAVKVTLTFVLPRRKAMPTTRATPPHTKRPDLDKLVRAVLDALTNIVYVDDSQVVSLGDTKKRTAELNELVGVHITIATQL